MFGIIVAGCSAEVVATRPADVIYVRPVSPGSGNVWISGDWVWSGGNYRWHEGYWHAERAGHSWQPGGWENHREGYRWKKGHW